MIVARTATNRIKFNFFTNIKLKIVQKSYKSCIDRYASESASGSASA